MKLIRKYKIYCLTGILPIDIQGEIISYIESIINNLIMFKHKDYPNNIFYMDNDNGKWIFLYNTYKDIFHVREDVLWYIFKCDNSLQYSEITYLIKTMVEKKLNFKIRYFHSISIMSNDVIENGFKKYLNESTEEI